MNRVAGRATGSRPGWSTGGDAPFRALPTVAASFAVAGLSWLVLPTAIGYDPWSWLVWGRELAHLQLATSGAASSFKPLPVLVTAALAWTGSADPTLWLLMARAGAVLGLLIAFHLGSRLGGRIAGLVALVGLFTAYQYFGYLMVAGMSEPLCTGLLLWAVVAQMARRPRTVVALLFAAGLIRIEVLVVLAFYLLWWVSDRQWAAMPRGRVPEGGVPEGGMTDGGVTDGGSERRWVALLQLASDLRRRWFCQPGAGPDSDAGPEIRARRGDHLSVRRAGQAVAGMLALLVLLPVAWVLPDVVGSGDVLRSAQRATYQSQGGPLLAHYPGLATFQESRDLLIGSVTWAFVVAVGVGVFELVRIRRQGERPKFGPKSWLAGAAVVWLVMELLMAQLRVATGAPRYLLPGVALACVVAGCAWVDAGHLLTRAIGGAGNGRRRTILVWTCVLVVLGAWSGVELRGFPSAARSSLRNRNGNLVHTLPAAIERLGGRQHVLDCGPIDTAPLQDPALVWTLHIPFSKVDIFPGPKGTVFATAGLPTIPPEYLPNYHLIAHVGGVKTHWNLWTTCPPG